MLTGLPRYAPYSSAAALPAQQGTLQDASKTREASAQLAAPVLQEARRASEPATAAHTSPGTGASEKPSSDPNGLKAEDAEAPSGELKGRRKSLFIGINYYGSQAELHGCVDDVHRMLPLIHSWGFPEDEAHCKVLLDSPDWPTDKRPTKANIKAAMSWLVAGAAAGDALFMHYSGHGGREPRTDGRGEWHETLCPVDMEEAGMLWDSEPRCRPFLGHVYDIFPYFWAFFKRILFRNFFHPKP